MKKIFNLLKEKLIDIKNEEFDIRKFILLFAVGILIEKFSKILGLLVVLYSGLYAVTKGVIPAIIKNKEKIISFIKNTFKRKKKDKKKKNKVLKFFKNKKQAISETIKTTKNKVLKFFKKKEEKEDINDNFETEEEIEEFVEAEQNYEKITKEKKSIRSIIKNFKLLSADKFKFNLKVKRDINGCKIVNGSYRIKGNNIIDNKINLYTLEPVVDNEMQESQKTYVKTK